MSSEPLEVKLFKESWISSSQYLKAKEEQKKINKSLYACLIKLGDLTEEKVFLFFAQHSGIPYVRLSNYKLNSELLDLYPEKLYRENIFLPLALIDNVLYVCMANPLDSELINLLKYQANYDIYTLFAGPSSIIATINNYFGPDDKNFSLDELVVSPAALNTIPFFRESERIGINIPVEIGIIDPRINLVSSAYVSAVACDISKSGKALGVKALIFIPPQVNIAIKFPTKDLAYEAKGQVIRCKMEKNGQFFLGITFSEIKPSLVEDILTQNS